MKLSNKKFLFGFLGSALLVLAVLTCPYFRTKLGIEIKNRESLSLIKVRDVRSSSSNAQLVSKKSAAESHHEHYAKDASAKPWIKSEVPFGIAADTFEKDSFEVSLDGKELLTVVKDFENSSARSALLGGSSEAYIANLSAADGTTIGRATLIRTSGEEGFAYSGFFELENGLKYTLAYGDTGELLLRELSTEHFPGCAGEHVEKQYLASLQNEPVVRHAETQNIASLQSKADTQGSTTQNNSYAKAATSSTPVIDLLVVYTPEARIAVGGTAAMQALVANSVTVTNSAYSDSQVNAQVQLVNASEVNYIESGNFSTDLGRLRNQSDGFMDEVHALRNQYGADMVALITDSSQYCGIGYQTYAVGSSTESTMFSVTYHGCSVGNYSFAHELGHNLGAHHDHANSEPSGAYTYSHGHHFGAFRTIMAYAPGTRIGRFSNPDVYYQGLRTGVPVGQVGEADNAGTISSTAGAVSSFRTSTKRTISGQVTVDGQPLSGASVAGSLGTRTTDTQGRYTFAGVADGVSYALQVSKAGYSFLPASISAVANADNVHDFTASALLYNISGQVLSEDGPVEGAVLNAGALGTRITDASGNFIFENIAHGTTYTIVPSYNDEAFNPSQISGVLNASLTHTIYTLGAVREISGTIFLNGSGLANVTVSATNIGSVRTNSFGQYTFSNVPIGTDYSISPNMHGYAFTQSRAQGTVRSNAVHDFQAQLLDSDNDGLSDLREEELGTNPSNADTDGDGVSDGQELVDGTNPKDRGSNMPPLGKTLCAEWNGFLGGMYNILELVNMRSSALSVTAALYDSNGVRHGTQNLNIAANAQQDILVHDLAGFSPNAIGKICVSHNGRESDLDGRMAYYKVESGRSAAENRFEFAFSMPFANAIKGRQFVSFNTYQPSLDAADATNPVANWIQITNNSEGSESGTLLFYGLEGQVLNSARVNIPKGARRDLSAHEFGVNLVGLVEWVPDSSSALFQLRNVRYVYDNNIGADSFDAAFQLSGSVGSGESLTAPLDTSAGSAIVEVANVLNSSVTAIVEIYNAEGHRRAYIPVSLRAKQSTHIIADSMLNGEKGIVVVNGNKADSIIATVMQYGRTESMGIGYMYGVQAVQALGSVLRSSYNTYLNQGCQLVLANPTSAMRSVNVSMKRSDGFRTLSGMQVLVPGHGQTTVDICSMELDNFYGVVTVQPDISNSIMGVVVRSGFMDGYRFPTPIR